MIPDKFLTAFGLFYLITEWVIRILMLFHVPRRRSSAATRTWLLLIFFLPVVGLILYIIIGRIQLPSRRIKMQRLASRKILEFQEKFKLDSSTPALPDHLLPSYQLATKLGDFHALEGNDIELLSDYDDSLHRLLEDIAQARNSIHILTYIFEDDFVGQRFAGALSVAAERGVTVRLLIDSVGSHDAFKRLVPQMRERGVEVVELLPVGLFRSKAARFDLRNHRKISIIDHQIGYIGSQNIISADFVQNNPNEELVARVRGPVVAQLEALFYTDHYVETETELEDAQNLQIPPKAGPVTAQLFPSGPAYPRTNHQDLLVSLIHAARQEIIIVTPYFVPDELFTHALRSARDRGVEVSIIIPLNPDSLLTNYAQQSHYEELLECGVRLHLYRSGFLHAKHVTIDHALAVIGSTNIDIRSFALNAEASLLIYHRETVTALERLNDRYTSQSDLLDLSEWKKRPIWKQTLENLARLADSLL